MKVVARCTALVLPFVFLVPFPGTSRAQSTPAPSPTVSSSSNLQALPAPQPYGISHVPAQITSAHTVFLTNMGADPNFPINVLAAFNDIYARLQGWGRYQLVNTPEQADLVFQLHDIAPISDISGTRGDVSTTTSPAFEITVLDPRLNIPLYTLTSPVVIAGKGRVREHWVNVSEDNLVSRVKVLASQPLSATESADLISAPKVRSGSALAWIVGGSIIGLGVGGGFLLHHEFENSLAAQKASQDAFCEANHIPLSECAGG